MRDIESIERTPILEVSPDQELVIPASILAKLGVKPGQKFVPIDYLGSIRLMPLVSVEDARGSMPGLDKIVLRDLRGSLPDLDTTVERDEDRV